MAMNRQQYNEKIEALSKLLVELSNKLPPAISPVFHEIIVKSAEEIDGNLTIEENDAQANNRDVDYTQAIAALEKLITDINTINKTTRRSLAAIYQGLQQLPLSNVTLNTLSEIIPPNHLLYTRIIALKNAVDLNNPLPPDTIRDTRNDIGTFLNQNPFNKEEIESHVNVNLPFLMNQQLTLNTTRRMSNLVAELLSPGALPSDNIIYEPLKNLYEALIAVHADINIAIQGFTLAAREQKLLALHTTLAKPIDTDEDKYKLTTLILTLLNPSAQGGLPTNDILRGPLATIYDDVLETPANVDKNHPELQRVKQLLNPKFSGNAQQETEQRQKLALLQQTLIVLTKNKTSPTQAHQAAIIFQALDDILNHNPDLNQTSLFQSLGYLRSALKNEPLNDAIINHAVKLVIDTAGFAMEARPLDPKYRLQLVRALSEALEPLDEDPNAALSAPTEEKVKIILSSLLAPGGLSQDDFYLRRSVEELEKALLNQPTDLAQIKNAYKNMIKAYKDIFSVINKVGGNFDDYVALTKHYVDEVEINLASKSGIDQLQKMKEECATWKGDLQTYADYAFSRDPKLNAQIQDRKIIAKDCITELDALENRLNNPSPIGEPPRIVSFSHKSETFNGPDAKNRSLAQVEALLNAARQPQAAGVPPAGPPKPAGMLEGHAHVKTTEEFNIRVNSMTLSTNDGKSQTMIARQITNEAITEFYFLDPKFTGKRSFFYNLPDNILLAWARAEVGNFIHNVSPAQKKQGMDITGNLSKDHVEALMLLCINQGVPCYNKTGHKIEISDRQIRNLDKQLNKIPAVTQLPAGSKEIKFFSTQAIEQKKKGIQEHTLSTGKKTGKSK